MKHLVMKVAPSGTLTEEFIRARLEFTNAPRPGGLSPAQLLFGRSLRSCLPAHTSTFAPVWQCEMEKCDRRAAARAQSAKASYDAHSRPLPPLQTGNHVRIQDTVSKRWDRVGVVVEVRHPRDYCIRLPSGRLLWRNRRFLRTVPAPTPAPADALSADAVAARPARRQSPRLARPDGQGEHGGEGGV